MRLRPWSRSQIACTLSILTLKSTNACTMKTRTVEFDSVEAATRSFQSGAPHADVPVAPPLRREALGGGRGVGLLRLAGRREAALALARAALRDERDRVAAVEEVFVEEVGGVLGGVGVRVPAEVAVVRPE